jgi:thiamine kinase-like enzyme
MVIDLMGPYILSVLDYIRTDPLLNQYYDRVVRTKDLAQICDKYYNTLDAEDPWACTVHSDLWINNILFHTNESGKVDDVKFIDFQISYMSSPLSDLVFFLCISMERSLQYMDEMLELYRKTIINILEESGCNANQFSKEQFDERLKIDAVNELNHILLMIKVVELHEDENLEKSPINDDGICRLRNIIQLYIDKKWI